MQYVKSLVKDNSITFVCEHWLRPSEMHLVENNDFDNEWTYLKSSIDPTEQLLGRPFGGCGFICQKLDGIVYKPVACKSDRICIIEVISGPKKILTLVGVYLPYDDNNVLTYESYMNVIQEIQGFVDNCDSPCMIVGDFNTRLPQSSSLSNKWYKRRPFTKRSVLLYDFICDNQLYVANFSYHQNVNYTFFNSVSRSYIDHVLVPEYLQENVLDCSIQEVCADNTSDHLAIQCSLKLSVSRPKDSEECELSLCPKYPRPKWDDTRVRARYTASLNDRLQAVRPIDARGVSSAETAACYVNTLTSTLVSVMHEAASSCSERNSLRPPSRKQRHWWTSDCTVARDRTRLFFNIWKAMGKPQHGEAFVCYKDARRTYRKTCRRAHVSRSKQFTDLVTQLYRAKHTGHFWNLVRRTRASKTNWDAISVTALYEHFKDKFAAPPNSTPAADEAHARVNEKSSQLRGVPMTHITISEQRMKRIVKKLRRGCSAGADGITPEHLYYSTGTHLALHLSILLTLCLRFGCFPDSFCTGIVVPILKKPQLDPSKPSSYRPITVSVVISKLLEIYCLEECSSHQMHPCQFGFVPHRGTNTAIALAQDVAMYCCSRGSPVYMCSLDAEGAFDCVPHGVLFDKASQAVPDHCWRILVAWYSRMNARVKWHGQLSPSMTVQRGTRQGGLTSPFMFNLYYQDLIAELNREKTGVCVKGRNYNVYCYADDILLSSTTPTGLQNLINTCVNYVSKYNNNNNVFICIPQI